jgi:biopolymer transport protein ExbD
VTERTKEPATRERLRRAQDEPAIARVDDGLSLRDLTDEPAKTSERVPPDRRSSQGSTRSEPPAAFAASAPPPPPILPDEPPPVDVAELELDEEDDANDPQAEDEAATEFTLASRGGLKKEEDLDLAAMVDVAFQLILFFIVTATSMFYKTLEVPKPDQEKKDQNVQQQAARSLEELENDHILVEIDPEGGILVDHEPVPPEALVRTLMTAKKETSRPGILLVADFVTPHRNTVRALDAANEAGLRIALAKPGNAPPAATPAKSP